MSTKVYICNMELPEGMKLDIDGLAAGLSGERQNKIRARHYEKDRIQALGAGLLLDYGLRDYGLRERRVSIAYKNNGKPYLRDYADIHFNLSHSGNMVMAVFSDREAGCDVERLQEARMGVARRFFSAGEIGKLEGEMPGPARDRLFCRLWTLKESYLKVTGEGMRMALDSFTISLDDRHPAAWSRHKDEPLDYEFREFAVLGYQAAVCLKGRVRAVPDDVFFSFQNLQDVV